MIQTKSISYKCSQMGFDRTLVAGGTVFSIKEQLLRQNVKRF